MLDLEPIKNALNAIAPQPWTWAPDCDQVWAVRDAEGGNVAEANMTRGLGSAHGQFIADAPAYVTTLLAEVERLRAALRFYAEEENWQHAPSAVGGWDPSPVVQDRGRLAQTALDPRTAHA